MFINLVETNSFFKRQSAMDGEPSTSAGTQNKSQTSKKKFQLNLMPFEEELMVDTYADDLVFITAR